jgi:hypothetical protein
VEVIQYAETTLDWKQQAGSPVEERCLEMLECNPAPELQPQNLILVLKIIINRFIGTN